MAEGSVNVELRLVLDKMLRQDIPAAKAAIRANMAAATSAAGGTPQQQTERTAQAMDKVAASTKKATTELEKQLRVWRELNKGGVAPGMKIVDASGRSSGPAGPGGWRAGATVPMSGGGLATAPGYFGPTPPRLPYSGPPPPVISGGGAGGGGANTALAAMGGFSGRFGMSGIATAARAGPAGAAIAAVVAALLAMRKAIHEVNEAMERARSLYAKQLTSGGLPGGFIARRAMMAEIVGVSEEQVFQYGEAVKRLNGQLKWSVYHTQRAVPELTATAYAFKVLAIDIKTVFMRIAVDLSPMLRQTAHGLSVLAKSVSVLYNAVMSNPMAKFMMRLAYNNSVMGAIARLGKSKDEGPMGAPESSAMRLQTSAWERMGLVIGTGPGSNYPRETAMNTRKAATYLESILRTMAPRGDTTSNVLLPKGNKP